MPVPVTGSDPDLLNFVRELEERVAALETPQGPVALFRMASVALSVANAKENPNRAVIVTDLKTFAWSDGAHWYRTDTGAAIV